MYRLRLFVWNQRRGAWDEGKSLEMQYLYTISALAWKPDGSRIVCVTIIVFRIISMHFIYFQGTLCGSVRMIDCCLKRGLIRNRFETTYVGPSQVIEIIQHILSYCKQVIIKDVNGGNRVTIRSEMGLEIDEIKVMGKDRYVVAYTSGSLLLADIESAKSSEIVWQSAGNEKFYFENENVCNTCFV